MPRSPRLYSTDHPYYITARCIHDDWFRMPVAEAWDIFSRHLFFSHFGFNARIHAFVLMDNHFHLILSTPGGNIDEVMWYLMKEVSREMTCAAGRINQTFAGPYYSCLLTASIYYQHAYKYVYRNPVESGLCKSAEFYPFSTLNSLLGQSKLLFPVEMDKLLFDELETTLDWINQSYREHSKANVKKALKRGIFALPKNAQRRLNPLEYERS